MKTLFLHIGCGKTGSSALQVWLHNQSTVLMLSNVFYPTYSNAKLPVYQITSGNGLVVYRLLKSGSSAELHSRLKSDLDSTPQSLFYSSEAFQNLTTQDLHILKEMSVELHFDIQVIGYVRNIHDFLYSDYVQNVKRTSLSKSWQAYATEINTLQHLDVINRYSAVFENVHVLHYDRLTSIGIDRALLGCLGLDSKLIPLMERRTVNRTLTIGETQALLHLNQIMHNLGVPNKEQISRQISDYLIYESPEKEVFFPFQEEVVLHLEDRFGEAIRDFNAKFKVKLEICPAGRGGTRYQHTRDYATEMADLSKIYSLAFRIILNNPDTFNDLDYLANRDRYLVDQLRQKAIEAEATNLDFSYHLMKAALQLRPDGPVIKKKIKEYETKRKT